MPLRSLAPRILLTCGLPLLALSLAGCPRTPTKESQRLDQVEQRLQQIEQRLASPARPDPADPAGKPPAGVVKSLTFRMGSQDDRLRIYWSDGSTTDLPCTQEQGTWACG
jgi:hypothetical protein